MSKKALAPRGLRNNNPGNLKYAASSRWQGLADNPSDADGFCVFSSPVMGCRALVRLLIIYQDQKLAKDGSAIDTVREVLERYAPKGKENPSHDAYVRFCQRALGVIEGQHIDLHEYETTVKLARSICHYENGIDPYETVIWRRAAIMAGLEPEPEAKDPAIRATKVAGGATLAGLLTPVLDGVQPFQPLLTRVIEIAPWLIGAVAIAAFGFLGYRLWVERQDGLR